jgi:membrane-bound ClpP family serine protease
MPWIIILVLIALGIIFILLELLVVPGTTFIGIIGFISLALGVYQTFIIYGTNWGIFALIGTSIFSIACLKSPVKNLEKGNVINQYRFQN